MSESSRTKPATTRRQFVTGATVATAFSIVPRHVLAQSGQPAPSEKLNIGSVGVGGMQGANDVRNVSSENIYALCDVDENFLNKAAANYPKAKRYRDFREMLDKEHKNLNGITVTVPDHMHASVSLWAMQRGLAVHCQKPLTQSVWEARLLTDAATKYGVATQMGNQGYSSEATRMACEIIWRGDLGDIKEVHSMSGGGFSRGITEWPPVEEVPEDPRLGSLDRSRRRTHLQFQNPPDQLARFPRLRNANDRRLGHPHAGPRQLGAAVGQPDERRVHGGRGR